MSPSVRKRQPPPQLYIFGENELRLDKFTRSTGLKVTAASSMIISAGLRALEARDFRKSLPLRFEVADDLSSLEFSVAGDHRQHRDRGQDTYGARHSGSGR